MLLNATEVTKSAALLLSSLTNLAARVQPAGLGVGQEGREDSCACLSPIGQATGVAGREEFHFQQWLWPSPWDFLSLLRCRGGRKLLE